MGDVAITELTDLDADKVAGVRAPANGTPFLLVKAAADKETCPTCDGSGKIRAGNVRCPDCDGTGEVVAKSDSAEADEQEREMTGESDDAAKAAESAKTQNDLPDSAFAHIEPGGRKDAEGKTTPRSLRHYPVHDKEHADNAAARASGQLESGDADAKRIARAAMPKIKAAQDKFGEGASKGDVQEALNGTAEPEIGGHLDSGNSGLAGSVTGEPKDLPPLLAQDGRHATSSTGLTIQADGGESTYAIPIEATAFGPSGVRKASVIAAFASILERVEAQQAAAKDGLVSDDAAVPGSMPWESYDSATLAQVSECLAACVKAVECIMKREIIEGDIEDACELQGVTSAINQALGVAAMLSFYEQAEGEAATKSAETFAAKVGRVLSGKNLGGLEAARDHLNAVIDGARVASAEGSSDEETDIMSTVTKEELSALFQEEAAKALDEAADRVISRLEKNANNGGDISEGDIKPTRTVDADDVAAVGGSVDSDYVNKGAEGGADASADSGAAGEGSLEKELADVREQMESMQKSLEKIAKRPRAGGPLLTGQAAGVLPAAEGRQGEAEKGEADGEIMRLQKSLEAATDPVEREQLGLALSKARLEELYGRRFPTAA